MTKKKQSNIEFVHADDIARKPEPLALVLEAHLELLKDKTTDRAYGLTVESHGPAILAYNSRSNKLVGIITYYYIPGTNSVHITLSYVKKQYRRKGIWSDMRDYLAQYVYDLGMRHVFSGVFNTNVASLAANNRRGKPCITIFKETL